MSLQRIDELELPVTQVDPETLPEDYRATAPTFYLHKNKPTAVLSPAALSPSGAENLKVPKLQLPQVQIVNAMSRIFKEKRGELGEYYNSLHGTSEPELAVVFLGGVTQRFYNDKVDLSKCLCCSTDGEGRFGRPKIEDFAKHGIPATDRQVMSTTGQVFDGLLAECKDCPNQYFNGKDKPPCRVIERAYAFPYEDLTPEAFGWLTSEDGVLDLLSRVMVFTFNPGKSIAAFDSVKATSLFLRELCAKSWNLSAHEERAYGNTFFVMDATPGTMLEPWQKIICRSIELLITRLYPIWGDAVISTDGVAMEEEEPGTTVLEV